MDAVGRFHNREPRHVACPSGLDPQQFPMFAAHYFGVYPVANDADTPALRDLRFRRHVELLHRLGPRAVNEYLVEVGAARSIRNFLEDRIADFADLDAGVLAALGGGKLPASPIHRVVP